MCANLLNLSIGGGVWHYASYYTHYASYYFHLRCC